MFFRGGVGMDDCFPMLFVTRLRLQKGILQPRCKASDRSLYVAEMQRRHVKAHTR